MVEQLLTDYGDQQVLFFRSSQT